MASPGDLVTLANVKAWLNLPASSPDDGTLGMLITQISRKIISEINRTSLLPKTFTETRDGNGKQAMMLRNYPVTAIASLTVDGGTVLAAPALKPGVSMANGFLFDQPDPEPPGQSQSILLRGSYFNRGRQNVIVTYTAGYQVSAEPMIAATAVTAQQPYGAWGSDLGVVNAATGAALTKVAGAPAAGQYQISTGSNAVVGGYVFNAADAGTAILASYGYIPSDLAGAAMEWVAERYRYRDRIGMSTKSLGGQETTSFAITNVPTFIKDALQQYTRVATF